MNYRQDHANYAKYQINQMFHEKYMLTVESRCLLGSVRRCSYSYKVSLTAKKGTRKYYTYLQTYLSTEEGII